MLSPSHPGRCHPPVLPAAQRILVLLQAGFNPVQRSPRRSSPGLGTPHSWRPRGGPQGPPGGSAPRHSRPWLCDQTQVALESIRLQASGLWWVILSLGDPLPYPVFPRGSASPSKCSGVSGAQAPTNGSAPQLDPAAPGGTLCLCRESPSTRTSDACPSPPGAALRLLDVGARRWVFSCLCVCGPGGRHGTVARSGLLLRRARPEARAPPTTAMSWRNDTDKAIGCT